MPELTPGLIEDKIKAYNEAKEEYNKWVGMLGTSDAETRGDDLEKGNLNNAFKAFEEVHKDAEAFVEKHRNTLTPGSHLSSLNTLVNENAATFTGPRQDFTPDPGGRSVGAVRPSRRM